MMNKEDYYEGQLVRRANSSVDDEFCTVLEVHDSHIVLMHPRYGLEAIFYENNRGTFIPASREELSEAQLAVLQGIRETQDELDRKVAKAKELQKAIEKLDEAHR